MYAARAKILSDPVEAITFLDESFPFLRPFSFQLLLSELREPLNLKWCCSSIPRRACIACCPPSHISHFSLYSRNIYM